MSVLLNAALAVHPRAWREKYGEVVRSTLMDVADDRGGRVPLSETLPLALRGLWMRARGSVAFWGGLAIVAVILFGTGTQYTGFRTDPAWISYAMHLNLGLAYALPLLALTSGWAGARARAARIVGVKQRLRQLWRDVWPICAWVAVGCLAALTAVVVNSGWPALSAPNPLVLGAQAAMISAAIGLGYSLGAVLPRVLVIFVAPAAIGVVALLLFAWLNPWRIDIGNGYTGLASVPVLGPFLLVTLVGAVIGVVAVVIVAIRPLWVRALPMLGLIVVTVTVAVSGVPLNPEPAFASRPQSELVCSTDDPVVCLWPEQEAAFGADLRADMTMAFQRAADLGLPVNDDGPQTAARFGVSGTGSGVITGLTAEQAVNFYASTFIWDYVEMPKDGAGESGALMFSIAILLGVPPERAWPAAPDAAGNPGLFDASEIPDEAAAEALVSRWLTEGVDGVRAPS